MDINDIQPMEVFKYFREISAIPHGSGNVKQISDYLVAFAKEHGLKYRQDESFNVIIWKSATAGRESAPAVILQGHMDMVTVKTDDCTKDLEKDGLELAVEGDYLYANGTSLGADDGIAVAYTLALLASDTIEHPALEAVITVDEEVGMLGATALDLSDIKGRIMLNMDSEEEGVFTAGCAGGARVDYTLEFKRETVEQNVVELKIAGLTGGHSGTEIICQRANAIDLLGRLLYEIRKNVDSFHILDVYGGEKDNAIATFAGCSICADDETLRKIGGIAASEERLYKQEYEVTDPNLSVVCENVERKKDIGAMDDETRDRLISSLAVLPYGVQKMSNHIDGLVQTSLNKGILKSLENSVMLTLSVRSSQTSEREALIDKISSLALVTDAKINVRGRYPAWEYAPKSHLREVMTEVYRKLYNGEPKVEIIHAGVECGIIADKLDSLDCVSFGPDIKDIHTTNEKLDISSTQRTWELIKEVLKELANN
jgi:dipeptidase D